MQISIHLSSTCGGTGLVWFVCRHVQVVMDRRHIYMLLRKSKVTTEELLWKEKKKKLHCSLKGILQTYLRVLT